MDRIYALRGATTVENDDPSEIESSIREMMEALYKENGISDEDICFVHFSQTPDLKSRNAAAACRKGGYCKEVPLFCTQEAYIEGGLKMCLRALVCINHERKQEPKMVYLNRAASLRPDWSRK